MFFSQLRTYYFSLSGAQDEVVDLHLRSWGIACILGHMNSSGIFTTEKWAPSIYLPSHAPSEQSVLLQCSFWKHTHIPMQRRSWKQLEHNSDFTFAHAWFHLQKNTRLTQKTPPSRNYTHTHVQAHTVKEAWHPSSQPVLWVTTHLHLAQ